MNSEILFSIVIPTYNRARLIGQTIESVLLQKFKEFEVIIIDDGSTDDTASTILSINDARIRYFRITNSERDAARNFGARKSTGTYITFLDSDDLLKPEHLSIAKQFIEEKPEVAIFALGYDVILPDGVVQHRWKKLPSPVNQKLMEGNFLSCLGVFIQREVMLQHPFNEDRNLAGSEDYELWIRLAARYPIYTLPEATACLINHEQRSVLQINYEKFVTRIKLFKRYVWADDKVCQSFGAYKGKLNGFMDVYAALHLMMSNHRIKGLQHLAMAFLQYPLLVLNYRFWVVIKKCIFN